MRSGIHGPAHHWPYRTVVLPCLAAFTVSGLIITWGLFHPVMNSFDSARPGIGWIQADLAGQAVACLATAVLLIAAAQRPR